MSEIVKVQKINPKTKQRNKWTRQEEMNSSSPSASDVCMFDLKVREDP